MTRPRGTSGEAALSDLSEFRRLSAALSYMLTAAKGSSRRLLDMILGDRLLPDPHREEIVELIEYVLRAWAGSRRRLGPSAALHPLRATTLLVKALPEVRPIDLAVALLHDKVEDVTPASRPGREWNELEGWFQRIRRRLDPADAWELDARLAALSRLDRMESYCAYLGRLLDATAAFPDVLRAKLADRLDNTLDFSIDFRDPLEDSDFFEQVFQCLYVPNWPGPVTAERQRATPPLELSWRLYSLYKNIVLLSLLRSSAVVPADAAGAALAEGLLDASLREAQRIGLELLSHHRAELGGGRPLLLDAMAYCYSASAVRVTGSHAGHALDGLLVDTFDTPDPSARVKRLEALADNRVLLFEGAVAFLAVLHGFRNDSGFRVMGIGREGVRPVG